jgi:hypothetical protein
MSVVSCTPDLIKGQSSRPVPELGEYRLNPSDYDYENDGIGEGYAYVLRWLVDFAGDPELETTVYRFSDAGVYQVIDIEEDSLSAQVFNDSKNSFYGLYGVRKDSIVVLEYWSETDRVMKRHFGKLDGEDIRFFERVIVPYGARSDLHYKLVRKKVEFLDQYPIVYPGERAPDN